MTIVEKVSWVISERLEDAGIHFSDKVFTIVNGFIPDEESHYYEDHQYRRIRREVLLAITEESFGISIIVTYAPDDQTVEVVGLPEKNFKELKTMLKGIYPKQVSFA